MTDFDTARKNMLDCQIRTNGVASPSILQAFETVPREKFLPEKSRNIAYCDEDIPVGDDRYLLEPATHARMLEALQPGPEDVVLDIGDCTGYAAAILSALVSTVITVEEKKKHIDHAQSVWNALGACNIAAFKGPLVEGCAAHAPYDLIFLGGSVTQIPENLVAQLAPQGKMITILRLPGEAVGQVTLVHSLGEKDFSSYSLFEAGTPYLPGFSPKPAFAFQ